MNSDGVTLAQAGTPAQVRDWVTIYCTGLGAATLPVVEGQATPLSPLAWTVNPVTVTIRGQPATVIYHGLTPGLAGLYQVNAYVPAGVTPGNAAPVTLGVAGQTSPAVTMAVGQ